jgi:mRNA interferase MazF
MTAYKRGDVILVTFVFADETGVKLRPAVIVSSEAYHSGRDEVIIEAISSRTDRILVGDHLIKDWRRAGLLFPSVATGVVRTIRQNMIGRNLGSMPSPEMKAIDDNLSVALGLS